MRLRLTVLAGSVLIAVIVQSPALAQADAEAEIRALSARLFELEHLPEIPIADVLAMHTEDAIYMSGFASSPIENKDALMNLIGGEGMTAEQKALEQKFRLAEESSTSRVVVSESADLAFEYGRWRRIGSGEDYDVPVGAYVRVWQKIDGGWKIAATSFRAYDQE